MDAADLIASFSTSGTDTYPVSRRQRTQIVRGRAQPVQPTTLNIVACVQAATGRDLMRLPEGRRSIETRVLYTATPLFTSQQGGSVEADQVTIDGRTWEVQHVETWAESPPSDPTFFRCIVQVSR